MLFCFQDFPVFSSQKGIQNLFSFNKSYSLCNRQRIVLKCIRYRSLSQGVSRKSWHCCLSQEPNKEMASSDCSPNIHSPLSEDSFQPITKVIKAGHKPQEWTTDPLGRSFVNPPVYHASTITFPTVEAYREAAKDYPFTGLWYGRHGTPTAWALEEAFAVIEGGYKACAVASGVAAINVSLLAFLKSGDHVLMTDAVYDPTRSFCEEFLKRFGVQVTYYDPIISAEELEKYLQDNTRIVFVESPASLSFEIQNISMLSKVAHQHGAIVMMDNTWGPTLFQPFEHGVDVSINAATKYIGGHSDLMLGLIACSKETYRPVKLSVKSLGCPPGPDDCYLALRGIRTLSVRLKQHEKNALAIAQWLEQQPQVAKVMHPALPSHPQHELWKRDFSGSSGLFGFQLKRHYSQRAVDNMLNHFKLFSMGFSRFERLRNGAHKKELL
ncbi:cystathionine beta-lyase [Galdieria sulphuraria]|uniref:Cystathionine beta-lyase n=1 Tax=Galdieria sulphuraria TaxID=130081 RepID=M2XPA4_GALSU|nr:cystathionine beta-lyase [Galdieria sulphuraria]EME32017.1 cystathionine beta-lyase [Galdieria sulphuraria]|eukprot:XP_005708537.1 cystathionine beta-lyase [Galdieria sulphuraria]